jgi:hypothetical protein
MAHYAFLDENNVVTEVITGRDENDLIDGVTSWEDYYGSLRGQRCLRTSYNTSAGSHLFEGEPFRGNYAGIGYTYDEERDAFIPPQPHASWVLDEDTCLWVAPIAYPAEGVHTWDEQAGDWVEVTDETV